MELSPRSGKVALRALLAWVITSALLIWIIVMIRRHNSSWNLADRYAALVRVRRREAMQWSQSGQNQSGQVQFGSFTYGSRDIADWRGNRERCRREAEEYERLEYLYRRAAFRPWATTPREGPLR